MHFRRFRKFQIQSLRLRSLRLPEGQENEEGECKFFKDGVTRHKGFSVIGVLKFKKPSGVDLAHLALAKLSRVDGPTSLPSRKEVSQMKCNKTRSCYTHRQALEKLKQTTWILMIIAKFLTFLVSIVNGYLR